MSTEDQEIVYVYRGLIERGKKYKHVEGYSATGPDGGVEYPWMTAKECHADAKSRGGHAVFQFTRRTT